MLVHGWGVSGDIWGALAKRLAQHHRVIVPDLPGHGRSPWDRSFDAMGAATWCDAVVEAIAKCLCGRAVWVGWSLGGLLVLTAALRHPDAVERLILLSSTPKFVQEAGWSCALSPRFMDEFETDLEKDYAVGLKRFFSLMFASGKNERAALRDTRRKFLESGTPRAAWRMGLNVLRHIDVRPALARLQLPALVVHGGEDRLIPSDAARYLAQNLAGAHLEMIAPAGHAPFITHLDDVVRALEISSYV